MSQKTELTARIDVVDEIGDPYIIDQYQSFIQVSTLEGGHAWAPGVRLFKLGGCAVSRIDDHTFQVASTGALLKRI